MAGEEHTVRIEDRLRNVSAVADVPIVIPGNNPAQASGRQFAYFEGETALFRELYDQYAADYFEAQVQGLDPEDFTAWSWQKLRFSDMADLTPTATYLSDNIKLVLFASAAIQYVPRGAKIVTAGSTWLVTNPQSISGVSAVAVAERCAAMWHYFDWYGNIKGEPMVVRDQIARASAQDPQDWLLITKQYFNAKMQYNEATAQLNTNSRMILGSGAYHITGYSDFLREFTEDGESIHMVEFTLRYEEPNDAIDDMARQVAGGKNFSWEVDVSGPKQLRVGENAVYQAASLRCGEAVENSEEHPITYLWGSSDSEMAQVDEASGEVTAFAAGRVTLTAVLSENPEHSGSFEIEITEAAPEEEYAIFLGTVPEKLSAYERMTLRAVCCRGGTQMPEEPVTWNFVGAQLSAYSAVVHGNEAQISCWGGSVEPLAITVSFGEGKTTVEIRLEGI